MLTNGSFVSLKDIPTGSDEGSTRLTASTVDDSNSSDTSSGSSYNNVGEWNQVNQRVKWCYCNSPLLRSHLEVPEGPDCDSARPGQCEEVQHQRRPPGGQTRVGRGEQQRAEEEPRHRLLQLQGLQPSVRHGHSRQGSRPVQVSRNIGLRPALFNISIIAGTICLSSQRMKWPAEPWGTTGGPRGLSPSYRQSRREETKERLWNSLYVIP